MHDTKLCCSSTFIARKHSKSWHQKLDVLVLFPLLMKMQLRQLKVAGGPAPSDQVMLGGHEDKRDVFVSSSKQRKHPVSELATSGEAVDLRARLDIIEGHLTFVHVQEHAHLPQLRGRLHLSGGTWKFPVSPASVTCDFNFPKKT